FMRTAAPNAWKNLKNVSSSFVWEDPVTNDVFERLPHVAYLSRQGADQAGDQLTIPGGVAGGTVGGNTAGAIGDLPPSSLIAAPQGQTGSSPITFIGVQNKHGDWVTPSTASINAAGNAGNGTPLYALPPDVNGAY